MEWLHSFWMKGFMPGQLLVLLALTSLSFILVNHFLMKIGRGVPTFWQAILIWLVFFVILKYVIFPPLPASLFYIYLVTGTIALFLLISAQNAEWHSFLQPLVATATGVTRIHRIVRGGLFVLFPMVIGTSIFHSFIPTYPEPVELRNPQPAPPRAINVVQVVHEKNFVKSFDLQTVKNPFRVDTAGNYLRVRNEAVFFDNNPFDPETAGYLKYVREGGEIYFRNCVFCHGANLDARGEFAFAFRPIPVNLADPGTIAQLQESYVFWRTAKGGMSAPRESFPWDSSMPAGEEYLNIDDIWKVTLFLYWHAEHFPRTWD